MKDASLRRLVVAVLLFTAGGFLGLLLQGKGWYYHKIPLMHGEFFLAALLLYTVAVGDQRDNASVRRGPLLAVAGLLLAQVLMYPSITSWPRVGPPRAPGNELSALIEQHTLPGEAIVAVSMGVGMQFPAITYTGRPYGSRYCTSFPVVMAYVDQPRPVPRPGREWIDEQYYRELQEDIQKNRPRLLTVETVADVWDMPPGMTMLKYLEMKGFFSSVGAPYRFIADVQGKVSVFIRDDGKGGVR